ncbi:MAG: thioredoxin domain-containing protein [Patescibacteria group bacterium]|nr:DsbA family protein [Patescibacteria group bacterium]
MKNFWPIFALLCIITGVVFLIIITRLFQGDTIIYTDPENIESPIISKKDPVIGSAQPTIVIVEYSDFACTSCSQTSEALSAMLDQYPEDIALVWKDFPNSSLHNEAIPAAIAARCAQKQNAFWPYHDLLMANQRQLGTDLYKEIATELDLSMWRFNSCLRREKTNSLVSTSYQEGLALEVTASPTLYINGERFAGLMRESDLRRILSNLEIK